MGDVVRLDPAQRRFADGARRATLATVRPDGMPRLVPICFVLSAPDAGAADQLYSPLDEKPKAASDPRQLARVRDIRARPSVSLLIDRWSEDWIELAWLRLDVEAALVEPGADGEHGWAASALREKYPQYATHDLDRRPMLRFVLTKVTSWSAVG